MTKCPVCNVGMIILTSQNMKICDCGHKEPHELKPGQKSVLENKTGPTNAK